MRFRFRCSLWGLLFVCCLYPVAHSVAESPVGVLTLRDRQTIQGRLASDEGETSLLWQGEGFLDPFTFRFDKLKKLEIDRLNEQGEPTGTFAFELSSGDLITGNLLSAGEEMLVIDSGVAGELSVPIAALQRMYRVVDNPTLVFAHLAGLQDWSSNHWNNEGWTEDGTDLRSDRPDATLIGDLGVPRQAIIEFEVSWTGTPNFHLALGCDPNRHPDESSGWAVTCIGKTLAIFRERQRTADLDILSMLEDDSSVRLTVYLDQDKDEISVYEPDGTLAGRLTGSEANREADDPEVNDRGTGVMLTNRDGRTTLRRLRVAKWIGKQMQHQDDASAKLSFVTADSRVVTGQSFRLKAGDSQLTLVAGDDQEQISLKNLAGIDFRIEKSQAAVDESETGGDSSDPKDPQAMATVLLRDGARWSGRLLSISKDALELKHSVTNQDVAISMEVVRSITWRSATWTGANEKVASFERAGKIMKGHLVAPEQSSVNDEKGKDASGLSTLMWQPLGSQTAARLSDGIAAVISQLPSASKTDRAKKTEPAAQPDMSEIRPPNFESNLFLVSGDHFACRVIGSADEGLLVQSREGGRTLVTHDQIKAVELVGDAEPPALEDAKRRRLLTLPRLQKDSPPTHLLVAANGDMLRCRILGIDDDSIRVEIRLDEMKLPRERITQIIWLHPEDLPKNAADDDVKPAAEEPEPSEAPQQRFAEYVQAVMRDGINRVTFLPTGIDDGEAVVGLHDVFGRCRVHLADVEKLLLGTAISSTQRDDSYQQWILKHAKEPVVAAAMRGEMPLPAHTLNGQRAPEVNLPMLDGDRYRLSNDRGKIVVLDFWASWCAPCMETMPKVDDLIAEFDPTRVKLVTVNLSDDEGKIRTSLRRLNIRPEVALDVDGIVAERYEVQSIPQLVVIDGEGNIATVFIGGGDVMIDRVRQLIRELSGDQD